MEMPGPLGLPSETDRQTDPETGGQLDRQVWVDSGTVGASNVEYGKEVAQLQETWEVKGNVHYYIFLFRI